MLGINHSSWNSKKLTLQSFFFFNVETGGAYSNHFSLKALYGRHKINKYPWMTYLYACNLICDAAWILSFASLEGEGWKASFFIFRHNSWNIANGLIYRTSVQFLSCFHNFTVTFPECWYVLSNIRGEHYTPTFIFIFGSSVLQWAQFLFIYICRLILCICMQFERTALTLST